MTLTLGQNNLKYPVGQWLKKTHLQWKWFHCQYTDRIFKHHNDGWVVYVKSINATRSNMLYITSEGKVEPPNGL